MKLAGLFVIAMCISGYAQTTPYIDIRNYGAVGDGVTDNCSALTSAATACVSATMLIPTGTFATSCTLALPTTCSVEGVSNAASVVQALATMSTLIVQGDGTHTAFNQKIEGITADANGLASDGIFLRNFQHYTVRDVTVNNALVNSFHLGDSTLSSSSYEAYLWNVRPYRASGVAIPSASIGVLLDYSTDSHVIGSVIVGSSTGIRANTSGNFFTNDHVWSYGSGGWTLIAFDDNGLNNYWDACESDTAKTYGLIVRQTGARTVVRGCRFYNNSSGQDNVVIGISLSAASPIATLSDNIFYGADATHRLAQDVSASDFTNISLSGNQALNVVISNAGFLSTGLAHFKNPNSSSNANTSVLVDSGTTSSYQSCVNFEDKGSVRYSMCKTPGNNFYFYDYSPGGSPGSIPRWLVNHNANMQFAAGSTAATSTFDFLDGTQTLRAQIGQYGLYKSGSSLNTDIAGEMSFSASSAATYTFQDSYSSHPECWAEPQFDMGSGNRYWIGYSGSTAFTINFASIVSGTVSYGCDGRN